MSMVVLTNLCSQLHNASKFKLGLTAVPRTKMTLAIMLLLQKEGFISNLQNGSVYGPAPIEQSLVTGKMLSPEEYEEATERNREFQEMIGAPLVADPMDAKMKRQTSTPPSDAVQRQQYWLDRVKQWNPDPPGGRHSKENSSPVRNVRHSDGESVVAGSAALDQKLSAAVSSPVVQSKLNVLATTSDSSFTSKLQNDSRLPQPTITELEDSGMTPLPAGTVTQATVSHTRLWATMKYHRNQPVLHEMKAVSKPTRRITLRTEDLARLARGYTAKLIKGLQPGECMFVGTDRGVMEIREAVKRRLGGQLLCRVV